MHPLQCERRFCSSVEQNSLCLLIEARATSKGTRAILLPIDPGQTIKAENYHQQQTCEPATEENKALLLFSAQRWTFRSLALRATNGNVNEDFQSLILREGTRGFAKGRCREETKIVACCRLMAYKSPFAVKCCHRHEKEIH